MEIVSAPQTQIARDRESEREIEKERKRKNRQDKKFWQMSTAALIFSMYIPSLWEITTSRGLDIVTPRDVDHSSTPQRFLKPLCLSLSHSDSTGRDLEWQLYIVS